jgi:hypothetical protein
VPAEQATQDAFDVLPLLGLYVPAAHLVHVSFVPLSEVLFILGSHIVVLASGAVGESAAVMGPEDTKSDAIVSEDVRTLMLKELSVSVPMVKPRIVTVNNVVPTVAPDVVITTVVALVAPHVAVSPATLLAPSGILGVIDEAKKPVG